MLAFALGMAFLLIYIWYRTELDCGGCPYRMVYEAEPERWIDQYRDVPLIIDNEGLENIAWHLKPVTYSEDDLEEIE